MITLMFYLPYITKIRKKIKNIFNMKCEEQNYLPLLKSDLTEISEGLNTIYNKFKSWENEYTKYINKNTKVFRTFREML